MLNTVLPVFLSGALHTVREGDNHPTLNSPHLGHFEILECNPNLWDGDKRSAKVVPDGFYQ